MALAAIGLVVLWKGPKWQVAKIQRLNSKESFDRENEARKALVTILGGVVLLAGGFFTWRNIKLAQESLKVSQESLSVAQGGQITDRFTKAIDQLGNRDSKDTKVTDQSGASSDKADKKNLMLRVGGIYALEQVANESAMYHWPIVDVLCAYVRENAPIEPTSAINSPVRQWSPPGRGRAGGSHGTRSARDQVRDEGEPST